MVSIPIDIVNIICQLAAQEDKLWYPVFDRKTGKLTWKINKHCKNNIEKAKMYYHIKTENKPHTLHGELELITNDDVLWPAPTFTAYIFPKNEKTGFHKIYIIFTIENREKNEEKLFSTLLDFEDNFGYHYSMVNFGHMKTYHIYLGNNICGAINHAYILPNSNVRLIINMNACMSLEY